LNNLEQFNTTLSRKGFLCNYLAIYSVKEQVQLHLYYADPCSLFNHCQNHFIQKRCLLHDYGLYDFTLIVRKD